MTPHPLGVLAVRPVAGPADRNATAVAGPFREGTRPLRPRMQSFWGGDQHRLSMGLGQPGFQVRVGGGR